MNVHSQTPTRRGRRTRQAILDAALALFASRGFHGTPVPEIARAAGIAAGSIYRHFDSKEALVNELYREHKRGLATHLLADLDTAGPPRAVFARLWARLAGYAREAPTAFAFLELHHHGPYLDDDSRRLELEVLTGIAAIIDAARARGALRPLATDTMIAVIWGAFVGLVKSAGLGYFALDEARLAEAETACWHAIATPDAHEQER